MMLSRSLNLFVASALIAAVMATSVAAQTPSERRGALFEQTLRDELTGARALVDHDFVAAEAAYRRAWRTHLKIDPPSSADTATAAAGLAMALDTLDRDDEAATLLEQAIAARAQAPDGGGETLAYLYGAQGRLYDGVDRARARQAYEAAIQIDRALPGRLAQMVFNLSALADILNAMSRPEEALARAGWAAAIAERLGESIPRVVALVSLAEAKRLLGRPEAAIRDLRTAQALSPTPEENVLTALARSQYATGDFSSAAETANRAIAAWETLGPDGAQGHARTIGVLANIRSAQGHFDEAESLYRRALALARAADDPAAVMTVQVNMADTLSLDGRFAEAEPLLRQALADVPRIEGADSRNIGYVGALLANNLQAQGRDDEAIPYYEGAIRVIGRSLGDEHPSLASTVGDMARSAAAARGEAAADPFYRRAMALSARLPRGHPDAAIVTQDFARHRLRLGEPLEALTLLRPAAASALSRGGRNPAARADPSFNRVRSLFRLQVEAAWSQAARTG